MNCGSFPNCPNNVSTKAALPCHCFFCFLTRQCDRIAAVHNMILYTSPLPLYLDELIRNTLLPHSHRLPTILPPPHSRSTTNEAGCKRNTCSSIKASAAKEAICPD